MLEARLRVKGKAKAKGNAKKRDDSRSQSGAIADKDIDKALGNVFNVVDQYLAIKADANQFEKKMKTNEEFQDSATNLVAKLAKGLEIDEGTIDILYTVQGAKKSVATRKAFCRDLVRESTSAADAQTYLIVFGQKTQCVLENSTPLAGKIKKLEHIADGKFEPDDAPSAKKRKRNSV